MKQPVNDNWRLVRELCERLERDYQDQVGDFNAALGCFASDMHVVVEILIGLADPRAWIKTGKMWSTHVVYARRRGFFGPRVRVRDLAEVERELRVRIENWLATQPRRESSQSGGARPATTDPRDVEG
jgi:hypothetical protein